MLLTTVFLVVLIANILATVYDVVKTEQGLKKGVGQEGNEIVTNLFGAKPGSLQLYLWNFVFTGAFSTAVILWGFGPTSVLGLLSKGLFFSFIGVDAARHYLGGRLWDHLLTGKPLKKDRTAWEKFLGLGIDPVE